jgi:hypothetical protein
MGKVVSSNPESHEEDLEGVGVEPAERQRRKEQCDCLDAAKPPATSQQLFGPPQRTRLGDGWA